MRMIIGSLAALVLCAACGDPEPAKTSDDVAAETTATATSTAPDMPAEPVATAAPTETAQTAAPPPVEEAPALVFEGIKLKPTKPAKVKVIEVKPDGAVVADGKTIATFAKNEIRDEAGSAVFKVAKDGTVEAPGKAGAAKFNETDDLTTPDSKLTVGKDGAVSFEKTGGKPEKAPFKIEGLTDKNRRAAVLLTMYLMSTSSSPGGASTTPASGPAATPAGGAKDAKAPAPATTGKEQPKK
ncbi:MAG: hypothetical protein HOW73_50955 [Polyangiaceae bacterium]|nr:hypothetical protein [Polyangiaceae bacterium]